MPLPKPLRTRVPDRVRDNPSLRALALAGGLIPPRPMHSEAEAKVLTQLARTAHCVVELGVYEGSSAFVLCDALVGDRELHLIDPFVDAGGWSLRQGWRANPTATRLAVRRRARGSGPRIVWHVARSQDVGRGWPGPPVDLVFVDGDHSLQGCREDWEVWHPHVRSGGAVAFHDARAGRPDGHGHPGPTSVVDELFRAGQPPHGWSVSEEVDSLVVVRRLESGTDGALAAGGIAGSGPQQRGQSAGHQRAAERRQTDHGDASSPVLKPGSGPAH